MGLSERDVDDASLDVVFDLLTDRRRRCALACLADSEEPLALSDLARDVAVRESEARLPEIPGGDIQRIHVSLHHTHVPKLAEAGVVEYDRDPAVVALPDAPDAAPVPDATDLVERVYALVS